jgi:hypothetical protein
MKNSVWVAISFSMLAAAAAADAKDANQTKKYEQEVHQNQGAAEAGTLIGSLQIGKKPNFEKPLPCYAR